MSLPDFLFILFLIALFPRLHMAWRVGMTWDEGLYILCGSLSLRNLLRRDFSEEAWGLEFHSPFIMYLFGLSYGVYSILRSLLRHGRRLGFSKAYEEALRGFHGRGALLASRLPAVLLGSLSVPLLFLLVLEVTGVQEAALLAALFLALLPVYIAWTSLAMLEGGVTFFILLTLLTLVKGLDGSSLLFVAFSGISLGMAFASREFGYFVPIIASPWLAYVLRESQHPAAVGGLLLLWLSLGALTFYLLWPFLWRRPVKQFLRTFRDVREMEEGGGWNFFLVNFLATAPVPLLLLSGIGTLEAVLSVGSRPFLLIFLGWFFIPLLVVSLPPFPKRGGVYELTFLMPSLAALGGLGVVGTADLLGTGPYWIAVPILLWLLLSDLRTAPYYMDYYNLYGRHLLRTPESSLIPPGWWGEGMDEAMEFLDSSAEPGSKVWVYGPKATALYHSSRADLVEGGREIFHERAKTGLKISLSEEVSKWKGGDLEVSLPYYQQEGMEDLSLERLRKLNVDYLVIYRWALYSPTMTRLSSGHRSLIQEVRKTLKPLHTVRIKEWKVCWVYWIKGGNRHA
jgi:hypothetical protein